MDPPRRSVHFRALDGLRGIAAAIVVVRHTIIVLDISPQTSQAILQSPLALVLNATGAVHLFFVLSGTVLAGSALRHRGVAGTLQFYVRRVFRIYPPYAFALVATWIGSLWYATAAPNDGLGPAFDLIAAVHLPFPALLESLLVPDIAGGQLPVGWTLKIELVYSFLFPLLVLVALRAHWLLLLAIFAVGVALGPSALSLQSFQGLLLCSINFTLGIAALLERERLAGWIARSPVLAVAGPVLSAFLFAAPLALGWTMYAAHSTAVMAIGSAGLVVSAMHVPWVARWLSSRPTVLLGRVSFSVYLLHMVVLILCAPLVATSRLGLANVLLLIVIVLTVTVALSLLTYRWVEQPSIAFGNRVCAWLARRTGATLVASRLATPAGSEPAREAGTKELA